MSLKDKCWAAFRNRDHKEGVRLLPLVKEPNKIKGRFIGWNHTSLLHLSLYYGWLDVAKDLITKYHCDPHEKDSGGETCLHWAARGNHVDVMRYLIDECHCDPMTTNNRGETVLHKAAIWNNSPDVIKYLINECSFDPMTVDKEGKTPLHYAVRWDYYTFVECLLSTGKCDPLAKDNEGTTPLQLAKMTERKDWAYNTLPIFKKFSDIKSSNPIDSYVNILLVGNSGAGKSTLSHVINDTATGSIVLGSVRNVGGIVPCTAGIIPYKLQHRTLGNIILHDFAGHSEYYSSHSAVIENLLQGSGGVFLIVVNILEKEPVKQLHQWLTVITNEAQKALNQCHVIVIVSHVDEISNPVERRRRKEEIQEIIVRERCDSVFLDCRKLGGSGVDSFFNKLSSACESIRSTSGRNLSLYCHMMYGLLEERKKNILTLSDVMSATEDNNDYNLSDKREDVLDALDSLHSIGLISVLKSEDKVWVVVNKGILLTEVDGTLFAPETFKEHIEIASNTGIVSVSGLTRLFPKYDPDMLICFLKNMELCQQMNDPSFLRMTNLHQLAVENQEEGGTERRGERLLFFPCLLSKERPDEMTSQVYQFGWCLQCTSKHHFFPPRYFHVLSLRLAYKMALPQEDDNLEVKELVIGPKELAYPVNTPRERTVYSVKAVLLAVVEKRPFLVTTGTRHTELKEILPDESLSDISNLSLLGGRDIKEVIEVTEEFKTPLTPIKLDIKDLDIVIKELTSDQHLPCSVWHRLGLQLGLYDPRLVDIDKKNKGDPVECFRECMSAWLRGEDKVREKKGPSWSSLAIALDTIEEKSIASYIRNKYCTSNK
uniref:Death domain-containing protein n=1 Tax=Amphimedon queenslandica TaxID=400682 RepID=A0A1X7TL19_AMPQE